MCVCVCVSTDTLIELAELVLQNNYFDINERYLKQIRGTTIGTKFAPPYAILYTAALEENFLETLKKSIGCGGGILMTFL